LGWAGGCCGRRRTIAMVAEWWSIEVLHGEVSAFRWQEQHGSALIEAALTNGVRDGTWHADRWGVVFEVLFDTEDRWEAFRGLPVVRAALDAVPDPVNGLLIYRGRGGGAGTREPRRPKPAPSSAAVSLPGPADEPYLDLAAVSAPAARPTTAGALQQPPDTCPSRGLAEMTLTDTMPVLRPSVRGTEKLAAIGGSVTGRQCLKTVPCAGTAVRRGQRLRMAAGAGMQIWLFWASRAAGGGRLACPLGRCWQRSAIMT
jgi:hypothetical protein